MPRDDVLHAEVVAVGREGGAGLFLAVGTAPRLVELDLGVRASFPDGCKTEMGIAVVVSNLP